MIFGPMERSAFERRRRTAARVSLYVSLIVSFGILGALILLLSSPPDYGRSLDWYGVDYPSMPEVQILQGYLRVDTTADLGSEIEGARYLAGILEREGIPYHLEEMGDRHANLWAILEGEDPQALVLHHHIDTEPLVYPEAWIHPPFGGVIEGPFIYGRGAFDMKSVAAAQLWAFLEVARSGRKPERSIVFLATSSEEVGSELGTRHILEAYPELVDRFWGVLTEGGLIEITSRENIKFWGVEFAQKRFADLRVDHPERARLETLREDLLETGFPTPETGGLRLTEPVETFLEGYAHTRQDPALEEALANPRRLIEDPAAFEELPKYFQSMFRDEAVPFGIEELDDGTFRLPVKLHLLPGTDPEEARRRLVPDRILDGVDLIWDTVDPASPPSPLDHELFRASVDTLQEARPDATVGPVFLPWTATDSRFYRAAGIPSYGFSPFLFFTSETSHVEKPSEKVSIQGYVEGVETYRRLVERLAGVNQ